MSVYNQRYAYSYLVDRGFTRNAAAGIVGNLIQESGVDPHSNQVGGPGMGICQWTETERWQSLLRFARTQGRNPYSLDLQLDFMLHEMKQYGIYSRMQKMYGLEKATRLFMNVFERPDPRYANLSGRVAFARTLRDRNPNMATGQNNRRQGGGDGGGGGGGGGGTPDMSRGEYGFTAEFLDSHPEIRKLVEQADRQDWTLERFQAELKETKWYRKLSDAQQRWSVLVAEQPAQARREVHDQRLVIERLASQMGVTLSNKDIEQLATRAARNQLDTATLTSLIGEQFRQGERGAESGGAAITIDQIRTMAEDYGVKVDRATMQRWTTQVISGEQTVEGLVDRIREQAKNMLPHLGDQLNRYSTRDLLEPYLNMASEQLGIPTDQMRTSDMKWLRAIARRDGPLSMDDWTVMLRTDPRYDYGGTLKGQGEAAALTTELAQRFAVI